MRVGIFLKINTEKSKHENQKRLLSVVDSITMGELLNSEDNLFISYPKIEKQYIGFVLMRSKSITYEGYLIHPSSMATKGKRFDKVYYDNIGFSKEFINKCIIPMTFSSHYKGEKIIRI